MRRVLSRLRDQAGFSLTEVLATLVVLALASGLVAVGVPVAARTYEEVVDSSNAQVLLSTTTTLLRSKLENAKEISVTGSARLQFTDGTSSDCFDLEGGGDGISLGYHDGATTFPGTAEVSRPLVPANTATNNLRVSFGGVSYAGGTVTFERLEVTKPGRDEPLARLDEYKVRPLDAARGE